MSILIKGIEMPKSCWVCSFCRHFDEPNQGFFCLILEEKVDYESSSLYTKDNCPLVPVPSYEELLKAAKAMHTWIFLNSYDEQEAYDECGLSDEMNAVLGYAGSFIPAEEGE